MRLTLQESRATLNKRVLDFLKDAYLQIKNGDEMPRMIYTAMSYHLGWDFNNAVQQLKILHKVGWKWHWVSSKPTARMAATVIDWVTKRKEGRVALCRQPNPYYEIKETATARAAGKAPRDRKHRKNTA